MMMMTMTQRCPVASLAALAALLAADFVWLSTMTPRMYAAQFRKLQPHFQDKRTLRIASKAAAAACYVAVAIALLFVAVPLAATGRQGRPAGTRAFSAGALVGFVVYAVYNLTNAATLSGYEWLTAAIDTAWGTVLFGGVTLLWFWVRNAAC